jgi:hypothetical protein
MSVTLRLSALALFLSVLSLEPTPMKAISCYDNCEEVVTSPPFYGLRCTDCFAGQICAEEYNCIYHACEPSEAGAYVLLQC